jgi:hypothetical protein
MGASDNRKMIIANHQFGNSASTPTPTNWYLGLSTTTPAEDGTGFSEPVGNNYSRVLVPNTTASWDSAAPNSGIVTKANKIAFTFPVPSGNWGQITHYGFFLNPTGGQPEWTNPLDAPITPKNGNNPVEFAAGQLVMSFD